MAGQVILVQSVKTEYIVIEVQRPWYPDDYAYFLQTADNGTEHIPGAQKSFTVGLTIIQWILHGFAGVKQFVNSAVVTAFGWMQKCFQLAWVMQGYGKCFCSVLWTLPCMMQAYCWWLCSFLAQFIEKLLQKCLSLAKQACSSLVFALTIVMRYPPMAQRWMISTALYVRKLLSKKLRSAVNFDGFIPTYGTEVDDDSRHSNHQKADIKDFESSNDSHHAMPTYGTGVDDKLKDRLTRNQRKAANRKKHRDGGSKQETGTKELSTISVTSHDEIARSCDCGDEEAIGECHDSNYARRFDSHDVANHRDEKTNELASYNKSHDESADSRDQRGMNTISKYRDKDHASDPSTQSKVECSTPQKHGKLINTAMTKEPSETPASLVKTSIEMSGLVNHGHPIGCIGTGRDRSKTYEDGMSTASMTGGKDGCDADAIITPQPQSNQYPTKTLSLPSSIPGRWRENGNGRYKKVSKEING